MLTARQSSLVGAPQSVRLNGNSWQARGLLMALPIAGGNMRDLVSGITLKPSGAKFVSTSAGIALDGTSVGNLSATVPTPWNTPLEVTSVVWFVGTGIGSASSGCGVLQVTVDNAASAPFVQYGFTIDGASELRASYNNGLFKEIDASGFTVSTKGLLYCAIARLSSSTHGGIGAEFFLNGVSQGTSGTGISGITGSTSALVQFGDTGRVSNFHILEGRFYSRWLNDPEVALLSLPGGGRDLYWTSGGARAYVIPAAAGGSSQPPRTFHQFQQRAG